MSFNGTHLNFEYSSSRPLKHYNLLKFQEAKYVSKRFFKVEKTIKILILS